MMDQKSWLWKKKSTEKTIVAADKVNLSQGGNQEEVHTLLNNKAEPERDLKILNEKLSSAISECNAKDDLVEKHAKMAQEALAGWEKAESEAMSLKQELDDALRQRVAGEERLNHLDRALKECTQQLRFVREEQEQRINDAVMKTSREFGKAKIVLEEKLADANKRLTKLGAENSQLSMALLSKEKLIEDMNARRAQAEADFNTLMTKLESTEKENASLKYEVRVLEKKLDIWNEEREFNHRTADVAHKQHLENVKKIAKLESECQRLRILIRKRLPGPAALAKMKNEVEILGRDPAETRRRKSNPSPTGSMDFAISNSPDTPSKRINFLTEQLCTMEEENGSLKETLEKNTKELHFSRIMYARTASKLSQVEAQLEECSKGQIAKEPTRYIHIPHELSLASMSEMGSDDKVSCADSWASALISEVEHFRNGKQTGTPSRKAVGASGIDLMDDFVEMEKLAIVSTDKPFGSSRFTSVEEGEIVDPLEIQSGGDSLVAAGREIVLVPDSGLSFNVLNQDIQSNQHISGYISQRPPYKTPSMDLANRINGDELSLGKKKNQQIQSNLSKSICKIIELIEGISLPSPDYGASETFPGKDDSYFPYKNSETPSSYMVRVFQWKTTELGAMLQQFIQACKDLLTGKADVEKFAEELTSALDWVVNHCFSLQDVSSVRDAVKKHFDRDEPQSESEVEGGATSQLSKTDKLRTPKEQLLYLPSVSAWNDRKMEKIQPDVEEESKKLKNESTNMGSANEDMEGRLQSKIDKGQPPMIQLQDSEKTIKSLQAKLETLKESKGMIESKLGNEDDHTRLTVARVELNEAPQRFSSLQTELENENNCCEELVATCLQLESVTEREIPKHEVDQQEKQLRTDWEISAASEKLAECQETILNLGRQLKALASPRETALFDKLVSNPLDNVTVTATSERSISQRSSLLEKMLAEDNPNGTIDHQPRFLHINGTQHMDNEAISTSLAIVPTKKKGSGGLLKKLLWRRKKVNSKKITHPFAA